MVYSSNFVVALKSKGKVLRERQDEVYLPFGSEFSVLLKNLDDRRAVVTVEIDGRDVLDGEEIVIDGNSDLELQGFMDGNTVKRKFRFIEKNKEISEFRGDFPEDGIVKVKVRHEISRPPYIVWSPPNWFNTPDIPKKRSFTGDFPHQVLYTSHIGGGGGGGTSDLIGCTLNASCSIQNSVESKVENDAGITVEGSKTNQYFFETRVGELTDPKTICLKIRGGHGEQKVTQPLYARRKIQCKYCGYKCQTNWNNCPGCGAAVIN